MGFEEAARSSRLFGGEVRLERIAPEQLARRLARGTSNVGLIGGETTAECLALASAAPHSPYIYMNTLCAADDLRGRDCRRQMFHVAASERMLADARATADESTTVAAWDASLQAFGADTLNQRFRARFSRPMDGDAWAGWFAVKALAEGTLRAPRPSTAGLIAYLEADHTGIDGHKGRPLSFRSWDHQLRQPLYLSSPARPTPIEVPHASADSSRDSRDVLDTIGATRTTSTCHFPE